MDIPSMSKRLQETKLHLLHQPLEITDIGKTGLAAWLLIVWVGQLSSWLWTSPIHRPYERTALIRRVPDWWSVTKARNVRPFVCCGKCWQQSWPVTLYEPPPCFVTVLIDIQLMMDKMWHSMRQDHWDGTMLMPIYGHYPFTLLYYRVRQLHNVSQLTWMSAETRQLMQKI